MRFLRRALHVFAWIGTLIVALVALSLIVSQTPWFRDWIRRTIIREAKQYLDGELTVGRLSGNLFFGVDLADVAVDVSGERVVAAKNLTVDYSVFQLFSKGIVVDRIALNSPVVRLRRDEQGWNIGRLVKAQRREANREGPNRPITLPSITITDGTVVIDDRTPSTTYKLPHRLDDLDVTAKFLYEPVHFTIDLTHLNARATDPDVDLRQITGRIAVRDDNLYFESMAVRTGETALDIGGVLQQYRQARILHLVTKGKLSVPELGRILPALSGYDLHPDLVVNANGTADRLLLDMDVRSEAGLLRGRILSDLVAPDFKFSGPAHVERLNLAPILKMPAQRSDITGDLVIDLTLPSNPAGDTAFDRLGGTFSFRGPRVIAMGYDASQVQAAGSFKGPRITLSSAKAQAYGGSATTSGTIVLASGRRPIEYDLKGTADRLDLRRLPASLRVPKLETVLSIADYHVTGSGAAASGSATLNESTVEGATIDNGTIVEFDTAHGPFAYGGRGTVSNLDVRRLGRALAIVSLDDPLYDGRVGGSFDVKGSGTSLDELTLNASGTLVNSTIAGTHTQEMTFKTDIANRGLTVYAKGPFDQLNPAVIAQGAGIEGNVNGSVDGTFAIADLTAPFTQASFTFDGRVTLLPSLLGGVQIAAADVEGRYANQVADVRCLQVKGPDVTLDASGQLALDRTSASNLKYRVDATNISEVGRIAGQTGLGGSIVLDGTITGNAASLESSGTLNGSNLAFENNKALDLNSKYTVAVKDLDFVNARVQATSEATFVALGALEINQLTATTTYEQKTLQFTTKLQERTREVEARGTLILHPDHQELHLPQLALRTQGVEWSNAPGSEAAIQYREGQVALKDFKLISGDQSLDVNGAIVVKGAKPSGQLEIHARNVDIAQIEQLALTNRGLSGRLTADATVAGTVDQPIVDGKFEVTQGGFQGYRYDSLTATVDYQGNRFVIDATLQQAPGVSITAKGTVPTSLFAGGGEGHVAATAEDAIDLRLQTPSLNLGIVQGFTTLVTNVGGTLQADVRVVGSGRDPHFDGYIEIRDGAFSVPRFGTSYSGLDTRIDLGPDRVQIRRFEILDEHGEQLVVSGQLAVHERQVGAVDITMESENFELVDNQLGLLAVNTRLTIGGEVLRPRVTGSIRVTNGRLEVDKIVQLFYDPYRVEALPETVVSAERTAAAAGSAQEATKNALTQAGQAAAQPSAEPQAAASKPAQAGLYDRLALDIKLVIPDDLVLRGRSIRPGGPTRTAIGNLNVTVGGDLTIRKDEGQPLALAGIVNTVRGTYQFQGRQFDLARDGTIRFTGEAEFNPLLDITATRQIPDTGVEARVHITGSLQSPELSLSSTPPLDESDVLALIIFNRPINELGTGERTSLAATAGGIATGFIASPLGESIGRALNLDLFEITTTAEGDTLGAGVTVGQQVGERAFLKLRQTFGDRTYSEFLLEYRLADFLRLTGSAAPETSGAGNRINQRRIERAGIDLIFFFSY
jgi:autotransporter translocation and assembly factor TamB